MSLLDEIAAKLAAGGIGTVGSTIFIGEVPPEPDAMVCLFNYGASPNDYTFGATGAIIEYPRFQAIARATTYTAARSKIQSIYALLDAIVNETLSGTLYLRIYALGAPYDMPRDQNGRYVAQCNFEAYRTPG